MRRFVTVVALLLCSVSFGISVTGCHKAIVPTYCSGGDSGPIVGQIQNVYLSPALYGLSLNQGEMTQITGTSATDCKGNAVPVTTFTYSTSNASLLDVQPTSGRLCAGTWNRNTGPVADFTVCTPTTGSGLVYLYANAGATSNPLPVYIHPIITSVVLGPPSTNCLTDPATNCSPAAVTAATTTSTTQTTCTMNANGCCVTPIVANVAPYISGCLSQGATAQLAARVYAGTGASQSNISCQVGHLSFLPQNPSSVTIDENGVASALQPGSTLISASTTQATSSAGYFSTCPPATIALSVPGTGSASSTNVSINQNFQQVMTAVVTDTKGKPITGLALAYVSTAPTTLNVARFPGSVIPLFPGAGSVTAVCAPPLCNPAPYNEIGLNGNGTPITSNPVQVTTPGTSSTILYMGSTQSRYMTFEDFTAGTLGAPLQLPFVPNSMVLSEDSGTLYLGSSTELMVVSPVNLTLVKQDNSVSGVVLSVSPDNSTVVISDPVRKIIYLYADVPSGTVGNGAIITTYGGVATSAVWSPDSQTVYITAGSQLLVHNSFTGWNPINLPGTSLDAAVTVPAVGAYLSGATTTGVSYCPSTTIATTGNPPVATNVFYPVADNSAATTDQLIATIDGKHIIGATATGQNVADIRTTLPTTNACPGTVTPGYFQSSFLTYPFTGLTASTITGVVAASDSSVAFVTYTGTGGKLPAYAPATTGAGTLSYVTLKVNGAAAPATVTPVAGIFSSDNSTFYAGTAGDNQVHLINRSTLQDTGVVSPKLPDANGNVVPPNLLAQHPRATQ